MVMEQWQEQPVVRVQLLSIPCHLRAHGGHPVAFGVHLVRGEIFCHAAKPNQLSHIYGSTVPMAGRDTSGPVLGCEKPPWSSHCASRGFSRTFLGGWEGTGGH